MGVGSRVDNSCPLEGFQRVLSIEPQLVSAGWDQILSEVGEGQIIRVKSGSAITFLLYPP